MMIKRPPCWNRSVDDFIMLYTQQVENRYTVIKVFNDVARDEHIIIFHCNDSTLYRVDPRSISIHVFTDEDECLQLINELTKSKIFLIISGPKIRGVQLTLI